VKLLLQRGRHGTGWPPTFEGSLPRSPPRRLTLGWQGLHQERYGVLISPRSSRWSRSVSAAPDTHGRKPNSDHLVLNATRHVLHIGVAWEDLPQAYGCGSGVTVWRRLRDWQQAGVWLALHHTLLGQAQSRRRDRLVARRGRRQPCRALRIRARSTPARPQTTRQRL